jgi:hypothetical protein
MTKAYRIKTEFLPMISFFSMDVSPDFRSISYLHNNKIILHNQQIIDFNAVLHYNALSFKKRGVYVR